MEEMHIFLRLTIQNPIWNVDADKCVTHSLEPLHNMGSNAQIKSNSFVIPALFVQLQKYLENVQRM